MIYEGYPGNVNSITKSISIKNQIDDIFSWCCSKNPILYKINKLDIYQENDDYIVYGKLKKKDKEIFRFQIKTECIILNGEPNMNYRLEVDLSKGVNIL